MNSSTTITPAISPDETEKARELIELGLALDPEARTDTLARLIAASVHGGPNTALGIFVSTGQLNASAALDELNAVVVPIEQERWVDALGHHIVTQGGRR